MNILSINLPGAHFANATALREHHASALAYETAVEAYATDGDDDDLRDALALLGFDNSEIQEHVVRPGWRMAVGYL